MSLKNTERGLIGFVILGFLLVIGYWIFHTFKWDLNGGLPPAQPNPAATITTEIPTPDNSGVGNHSINLPAPITPAGLPMKNVTPGINLTPLTTRIIPLTPGLL